MPENLREGKASPLEAAKLIEEMQRLIKYKGLDVTLNVHKQPDVPAILGCAQCTLCPCMICTPC